LILTVSVYGNCLLSYFAVDLQKKIILYCKYCGLVHVVHCTKAVQCTAFPVKVKTGFNSTCSIRV